MKKGISIWAFKDVTLENAFRIAKTTSFDGVELALDEQGEINLNSTEQDILRIKDTAAKEGVSLYSLATGLYWTYSLTSDDPGEREKAENIVRKQLDVASWLGCDTILVIPGMVTGLSGGCVVPYDVVYERAFNAIKRLAPYAEERNVTIGLENVWNKFLLSPIEMKQFIDEINSPRVGAYFDVGNVMCDGYPEHWIKILGSRIAKVHFKDYKQSVRTLDGFVDLLNGDVNYPAVMQALDSVGYNDWVTAEVFPYKYHPEALLKNTSQSMDYILNRK